MKKSLIILFNLILFFSLVTLSHATESFEFVREWSVGNPSGIAVDKEGFVYVSGNHRILKYTSDGAFVFEIKNMPNNDDYYFSSWYQRVAVDNSGNIYVSSRYDNRIFKFDSSGNYVTKWDSWDGGAEKFNEPMGIAVDDSGYVYVCAFHNNKIVKFDSSGNFVTQWVSWNDGEQDHGFSNPHGITLDNSGNVFVCDYHNNRIVKFDSSGNYITMWGSWGDGDGEFQYPRGIAVDLEGDVYVVSGHSQRFQKLSSDGTFKAKVGGPGYGDDDYHFDNPEDVGVDYADNVYVVDRHNNRIIKYRLTGSPTVEITNPSQGDFVAGTVPVQATVTVPDGYTLDSVEFSITDSAGDETFLGEDLDPEPPSYDYDWNTSSGSYPNGPYTVWVTATNTNATDQEKTRDKVAVVVANGDTPPTVEITSHADQDVVRGEDVTIEATASDNLAIARVEFYVDGAKVGEDTTGPSPYSYSWDTTTVEDGTREIKVIAHDTITQSAEHTIDLTVNNDETYELVTKWGSWGSGNNQLQNPDAIAIDDSGNIYVTDHHGCRIRVFTSDGTFLRKWGDGCGSNDNQVWDPQGIAVDSEGNVYVADTESHRVKKFSANGTFVRKWGSYGSDNDQLNRPHDVAVDSGGNVYVCDTDNHRIVKYSSIGEFQAKWGSQGSNDGEFNYPTDIDVDSSNNIYVTDRHNHRIQVLDSSGNFLRKWGECCGTGNNQLNNPYGIALDSEGNVYVADTSNDRIVKYTSEGKFITKWGSHGSGDLQFHRPTGIAVDSAGFVYVTDYHNQRVMKFRSTWKPTIEITNPTDNGVVIGTVPIQVDASSFIGISKVEYYIDNTLKDTHTEVVQGTTYIYSWMTLGVEPYGDGPYTLKAIAYNTQDKTTQAEVSVVVNNSDNPAPQVSITGPANESVVRLEATIKAEASDEDPDGEITKVEFYVDANKVGEDTDNAYEYTWDATSVEDGEREIKVIAYDSIGQRAEASLTVTVINHEEFEYVDKWSTNHPTDVALDKDGNLYVATNHTIKKYAPDGILISTIENDSSYYNFSWWMFVAVDDDGNIYVSNSDRNQIIKFDPDGNYIKKWGTFGGGDNQFNWPSGIAVDNEGNVYVCDEGNHRIVKYSSEGTLLDEWGSQGGSDGEFNSPRGIAVDSSNNIYVIGHGNHRIQVLTSAGGLLRKWGNHGYDDNQFRHPTGIALDSEGNVYIVDRNNWRIVKYTSDGTFLTKWGTQGGGDLEFECPQGIAVDSHFNVYVSDNCTNRITKFKSAWRPTCEIVFPTENSIIAETEPVTIQADADSAVGISRVEFYINGNKEGEDATGPSPYTYDWDTYSLPLPDGTYTIKAKAYNFEGKTVEDEISVVVNNTADQAPFVSITNPQNEGIIRLTTTIEVEASDEAPGEITKVEFYIDGTKVGEDTGNPYSYTWDATKVEDGDKEIKVIAYDSIGQMAEQSITVTLTNHEEFAFVDRWSRNNPVDVAVDKDGNIYVSGDHRISKYRPDGTLISEIESHSSDYDFSWHMCIAVDDFGNIYVTNHDRSTVIKFGSDGNYVRQWGSYGYGDYKLNDPRDIAVDSQGNVYVVDHGNNRIVKYDSEGTFQTEWGNQGGGDGEFHWPWGIAIDDSDSIYVADQHNHRIQVFDSDGEFLRKWGNHGYADNQFRCPLGIAFDSEGNVYIVDSCNYRIVKYTSAGTFLAVWGTRGNSDLGFECPTGIAVDSNFNVYVADHGNGRVTIFRSIWLPTVEIKNPFDNSVIKGAVPIQADAYSAIGISKVEFSIGDTWQETVTEKKPGTEKTYEYNWDTILLGVPNGAYAVKAKAYNIEDKVAEDEISLVVNNTKDKAPTLLLTSLENEAVIRLQAAIEAEASDVDGGISKVEFLVDGTVVTTSNVIPYENEYSYSYTWDATAVEDGEREIKVIAYDSIGQRAEAVITVTVINHEEFEFLNKWNANHPYDIAVDKDGNLLVADGNRISKYAPDGTLISSIEDNSPNYSLSWTMHVTVDDDGNIYVANSDRHQIIKFDPDGNYITKWGSHGTENDQFNWPAGIAVDSEGNVYVCDHNNNRIVKYDSEGANPTILATQGSGDGEFNRPRGIGIDASNNIYVTDQHNHRIQVFSSDWTFLRKWGSHGSGDNRFNEPVGIALDSEGNVYIADYHNHRIVKYTSTGTFLTKWGTQGSSDHQFECPRGIAVDSHFNVYVSQTCLNRITRFKSTWHPAVEIINPTDYSVVSDTVQIQANVETVVGISKVEFYIDETLMETVTEKNPGTENTYGYNWDTISLSVPNGTYILKTKATSIEGRTAEDEITVVVNNTQDKLPTVSITNLTDGDIIRLEATIEAEASDEDPGWITRVEFYVDGIWVGEDTGNPYEYTWDATSVEDGEREIKVIAYDSIGQRAEANLTVTVVNQEEFGYVDKLSRSNAVALALDKDRNLYVAGEHRVSKFSPDGTLIFEIENNSNDYKFSWWMFVAVDDSGNIYVSNSDRHTIVKFDPNGDYVTKWGSYGYGDYRFNNPDGIATDSEGNVYVSDYHNNRIVKYDSEGEYITELGSQGGGDGEFNNPQGIAIDDEDYIYVADRHNNRILVFKPDGEFLRKWGSHGYGDDQLRCAEAVALDSEGNVYVVDPCNYKVVKYTSEGTFLATWGTQGSDDLEFECPNAIAVDSLFNVYVADRCNSGRITIFKSTWRPAIEITSPTEYSPVSGTVTIKADVETAIGISKVEFFIDETLMATVTEKNQGTENTYEYNWDTISLSVDNGTYTLKAKATSIEGRTAEDEIVVVVNNTQDKAPTVSITNLKEGDTIRLEATIEAEASDEAPGWITKVEFYIDGIWVGEDTTNAYECTWDATTVEEGDKELKVAAYDSIGQRAEAVITITVVNHEEFEYLDQWSTDNPGDVELDKDENLYVSGGNSISKYAPDGTLISRIENNSSDYNLSWHMYVAIDDSGNIYVSNSDRHEVIKFDSDGIFVKKWGSYGSGDDQFDWPMGIAADSEGYVYVCDNNNHRIVKYTSDGTDPTYWGEIRGGDDGQFQHPQGIVVDDSDNVYIADGNNHRIQVFSSDGTFIRKWGSYGSGDNQLHWPHGIAFDSEGNVYIVDRSNHRVVKYTSDGTFLAKWGTRGNGDLQFENPEGVAVDSLFNVYVADRHNHRIVKFKSIWKPTIEITKPTDNLVVSGIVQIQADAESAVGIREVEFSIGDTWTKTVTEIKQGTEKTYEYNWDTVLLDVQDGPYTIKAKAFNIEGKSVDDEISVIVNNSQNIAPEVSITSPAVGDVVRKWIQIKADASDEDDGIAMVEYYIENTLVYTVTAASSAYSWDTTTVGDGETEITVIAYDGIGQNTSDSTMVTVANQEAYEYVSQFDTWDYGHPRGIAVGKNGHIYATFHQRIVKFTSTGGFLFRIDNRGSDDNYQLTGDMHIAVDDNGNIYVSCREIHTIIKFDPYGNYLTKWGSHGSEDDEFYDPEGLDVDSEGNVYVCDGNNHRIVKFDSDGGYLAKFGSRGHGDGQFQYPGDIALDDENNMYLVEHWSHRVQVLNSEGTSIRKWGNHGYGDGQFRCPNGVALDSEGNVYIADGCNNRVQKFSSDGTFITKWGSLGSGDTNFDGPHDLDVDSSGNIYVSDHGNRRIVVFRIIGMPIVEITEPLDNSIVQETVTIKVNAESQYGISYLEFFIDEGSIGTVTQATTGSTYEYDWDIEPYNNGSHEIKVVAYNIDLKSTETSISVVVNKEGSADVAPTVLITNLKNDAVIRGEVIIKANVSDDWGINKVEFYVDETLQDSKTLSQALTSYEYIYTWDTTAVPDGEKELRVQAYDTIDQRTWATVKVVVDNAYSIFSIDLSGAAAVYIDMEDNKLKKIVPDADPPVQKVISTDPDVSQFQFGPQGNLYIVFRHSQELRGGNSYVLVKVNPETNEYKGIDSSLTNLIWLEHSTTKSLQFDEQGNIYYFAHAEVGEDVYERVLRKYVDENNIEDIINRNMDVYHWLVRGDGTIVIAGRTRANNEEWLRKVNPEAEAGKVQNIIEPDWWWEWGWMAEFPDNLVYVTLSGSFLNLNGVYRLADDLPPLEQEDADAPYMGDKEGSLYKIDDLVAGHPYEYCKGIIEMGRVQEMVNYEIDDYGNVYGLCGHWHNKYRTVLKLYPEPPTVIQPQLIDRAQAMKVISNKLIIAGFNNEERRYKIVLYDPATGITTDLMPDKHIEVYDFDAQANGNILFYGLDFDTNKDIVGVLNPITSASPDSVRALGGYGFKELAELGGRPLSFGVFKEVSGSEVVAVSIAYLSSGSSVNGMVKIHAAAASPEGVERVEFYIDGELKATDSTAPYIYSWDTTAYSEGTHTIKVKVYDMASQTAVHEIPVIVNNTTSPGEIVLSTNQIIFAASTETSPTTDQKLVVENTGGKELNWTAAPSEGWIQISPLSGTGSGIITVSANPAGLSVGSHTGNITIKDPDATNSPQWVNVNLKIYSSVSVQGPFGAFETPQDGTSGIAGSCPLAGWALDDIEVTRVEIWREPVGGEPTAANGLVYIGNAEFVEGARPDVAEMYPNYPLCYQAGWGYLLLTNYLPNDGNGTYTLYAVAYDKEDNKADLGTKTISCDNSSASEPFGTIDTPTEGGEASGGTFINFGWALTPQPNSIPTDGSTITVYVNGEELGNPVYGQYRSDVANLFPGYANSDGAVGYFYLDTTEYRNGVHIIAWNVQDDGGNSADIGTRYFTIVNVDATGSFSAGIGSHKVDPGIAPAFRYVDNLPTTFKSVRVRSGNRRNVEPIITEVDNYGVANIAIREVERVQVELGKGADYEGYMIVGGALKPLPSGSTLNTEEGTFSWQPGAGFIGEYYLVFIKKDADEAKTKIKIRITILPKFSIY